MRARLLTILDKLDGAKVPKHPLAVKREKATYIAALVLAAILCAVLVAAGVSSLSDKTTGASDAAEGLLVMGLG